MEISLGFGEYLLVFGDCAVSSVVGRDADLIGFAQVSRYPCNSATLFSTIPDARTTQARPFGINRREAASTKARLC